MPWTELDVGWDRKLGRGCEAPKGQEGMRWDVMGCDGMGKGFSRKPG